MSRPTDAQIGLLWNILAWTIPREELQQAMKWIEKNGDKWEVSQEISRVKKLSDLLKLTKDEAFNSPIWNEYKLKMEE